MGADGTQWMRKNAGQQKSILQVSSTAVYKSASLVHFPRGNSVSVDVPRVASITPLDHCTNIQVLEGRIINKCLW